MPSVCRLKDLRFRIVFIGTNELAACSTVGRSGGVILDPLALRPCTELKQTACRLIRKIADNIAVETRLYIYRARKVELLGPGLSRRQPKLKDATLSKSDL